MPIRRWMPAPALDGLDMREGRHPASGLPVLRLRTVAETRLLRWTATPMRTRAAARRKRNPARMRRPVRRRNARHSAPPLPRRRCRVQPIHPSSRSSRACTSSSCSRARRCDAPSGNRSASRQPPSRPRRNGARAPAHRPVRLRQLSEHGAEQCMLGTEFVVAVRLAPADLGHQQAVVAHPGAPHLEPPRAARPAAAGRPDSCRNPPRAPPRPRPQASPARRPPAGQHQACAEAAAVTTATAQHVQMAPFEHAQAQRRLRQQHRCRGKSAKHRIHACAHPRTAGRADGRSGHGGLDCRPVFPSRHHAAQ
jgi:hypothetical protein